MLISLVDPPKGINKIIPFCLSVENMKNILKSEIFFSLYCSETLTEHLIWYLFSDVIIN